MTGEMMISKQKGIALLQALLITLLITVMAIGFSYNARDQVEIAKGFSERIEADLKLDSAKSEIMYLLSVSDMSSSRAIGLPKGWNLYSQPFKLRDGITVEIQDVAGLYPVNLMGEASHRRWLSAIGMSDELARDVAEKINKLQYKSSKSTEWDSGTDKIKRNLLFLQHEYSSLGVPPKMISKMVATSTIYPTTFMNPLTIPNDLLPIMYDVNVVNAIIEQRLVGPMSRTLLTELTGRQDYDSFLLNVQMSPIGIFRVDIRTKVNQIEVNRSLDIMLQPRSKPYTMLLQERNI
ncbi:hypothetical protein [Shewanella aestuarii]|uniref:General secretion pathway protein GspK n=1 Tax=Shewanella aestuarii TaxID=1028752 RepID=A0A6G9QKP2_9GAMM|nr:hypothetical protein [Shewanella aestuarii]QIR15144.1 hypothetical protein HBH39_12150 [Shewanella aestuarii]